MSKVTKAVLTAVYKTKPILIKIFPIDFLREVKKKLVSNSYNKMLHLDIENFDRCKYKDGINLIGNIRAETGLGQSSRLIANQLDNSNIEYSIYNYVQISAIRTNDTSCDSKISDNLPFNINLIHINPHELGLAFLKLDVSTWNYRYNIAFWLWELEEFPEEWIKCFHCLDEIWTPSEFTSNSIRKRTNLPVRTIPYCVTAPYDDNYNRDYFKLPNDKFLFLTMYDSTSVMERKNPIGVISAFRKAFGKTNNKVGLVIKVNNMQQRDLTTINEILDGYNNIYIIADVLEKVQVNSLIKSVDVFVSLHRAEGFGLVLAEAMLLGTPTIATNWSSNTEFMNEEVSCLVDCELVPIKENIGPFKKDYRWAEPKLEHAVSFMTKLYEDKDFYSNMAAKANIYIKDKLSMNRAVQLMETRISEIYRGNKRS